MTWILILSDGENGMERKIFVYINGKREEFHPIGEISEPIFVNDGTQAQETDFSGEISFSVKAEDIQTFIKQMKKEFSVVDITNFPAWLIKRFLYSYPITSKLVTRDTGHYQSLQMEEGFACVAGDYDTLFGVPLILDKKGKIKAAQIGVEKKGCGTDD